MVVLANLKKNVNSVHPLNVKVVLLNQDVRQKTVIKNVNVNSPKCVDALKCVKNDAEKKVNILFVM